MDELRVGERLDHYRLEELAARSGMACIYRATDLRDGRIVGIKVPHFEVESDPLLFDRFKREEEIGKRLDHPGVMKVYESEDRSRLYMVMQWMEGRLLRRILTDEKKRCEKRAIRLMAAICEALEYIHAHGVVHRDLKPENIMVDCQERITLIDFGIALSAGARRLTFGKLTRTMGTADYISPEQVKRKRGDARSDLYAAGVIFYEMLTGELPFQGPNLVAVLNDRLINPPIPPREVNPQISLQLQEIIYRALEREPEKRYGSAREFARDLSDPESVGVADRSELRDWNVRRSTTPRMILFYAGLAMIPVVILVLIFLAARGH
jgi:eukaryotic-like serine/threonine-protein kinase